MMLGAAVSQRANGTLRAALEAARRSGHSRVQLNLRKLPEIADVREALAFAAGEGVTVDALGFYGNPLQLDSDAIAGVCAADLPLLLDRLPAPQKDSRWRIVMWSGTLSGKADTPHPGNQTPGALDELRAYIRLVTPVLNGTRAQLLFRPDQAHVLSEPARALDVFDDDDAAGLALDVCGLLSPKNFHEREKVCEQAVKKLARLTGLVLLRDVRINNFNLAFTVPGQGQFGWSGMIRWLRKYCADAPWIVDDAGTERQVQLAREFVELQAKLAG